jgi:Transposase IS116/IS110/IS902 family
MHPVIEALCTRRGVSTIIAASVLASTGDLKRFATPRQLMAYFGLVPSEHSSGSTVRRGGITKVGNGEVRRVLTQAAWCYRFPARVPRRRADTFLRRITRGSSNRLERPTPIDQALPRTYGQGKTHSGGGDGHRARAPCLHVGYWPDRRANEGLSL